MAVASGVMARLKNGGAWQYFPGTPEFAVDAFSPGVDLEVVPVGEVQEVRTSAPTSPPVVTRAPAINGSNVEGSTMTIDDGAATGSPQPTAARRIQWR